MYQGMTDAQLILAVQNGDANGFSELYKRYFLKVYLKCYSFIKKRDEAYDLAQEILIKAFMSLNTFKGKSLFSTWLYSITFNYCINHIRKKRWKNTDILPETLPLTFETNDEWQDLLNLMTDLINHLPEEEKELLILKYMHGSSIESLSQQFGLHSSTIKMRLKRTKDKLNIQYQVSTGLL